MSVTIQNGAANPVPVTLTNPLSSLDVNVTNTTLDVDVTNTSFDVNVTNTSLPVAVSNFPSPMSVTYTNAPGSTLPNLACKNFLVRYKPSLTALTPVVSVYTAHTGLNVHLWHYKLSVTVITPGDNVVFTAVTPFTGVNQPDLLASAYISGSDFFASDLHIEADSAGNALPTVSVLVVDGQSTATQATEGYFSNAIDGAYSLRVDAYSSTTTSSVVMAITLDLEYTT
jgi:uncharacterized protein with FMN-binding domain